MNILQVTLQQMQSSIQSLQESVDKLVQQREEADEISSIVSSLTSNPTY